MNGLITTNLQENEIAKASDLQLGGDNGIVNLEKVFASLTLAKKNVVIGGKLKAYQSGTGLVAKMDPIIGYHYETQKMFVDHEGKVYMEGDTEPSDYITFSAADSSTRRDIVEMRAETITAVEQSRQFYNPETGGSSYALTNVEKRQILRCKVKKGTPGSDTAPTTDNGFVKIAEVIITENITSLEDSNILNITANINEENTLWSVEKSSVVNPGTLQDHQNVFRQIHNSDGKLKEEVVKAANILLSGTGALNGTNLLKGGTKTTIENQELQPNNPISDCFEKVANAILTHSDKNGANAHGATVEATANQIMTRDANGRSKVANPTEDYDITNKKYVSDVLDAMKKALYDTIHPVGYVYHQLPGTPSPTEMGLYGTWEELKFGGVFLRAAGDNSLPFTGNFKCAVSGTTIILDSSDQNTVDYETALASETATNLIVIAGGECRAVTDWNRGTHTITIDTAFSATNITNVLIGQGAELPNVKGRTGNVQYAFGRNYFGALSYISQGASNSAWGGSSGNGPATFELSLSKGQVKKDGTTFINESESVYRNGGEVRTQNLAVKYWKRTA